ncbi:hypothetical protein [Vagococcus penaei]|uniref:DinB/UmuC family translesion DNA polymerase n=1 Tax=Vagococcus penaei TaxID=633807 RepID=UPI001E43BAA3|nr:hypothetical protein [Vagococcus penaei]
MGIGSKLSKKLTHLFAIKTVHDLAFADPFALKKELGVIGLQLFAHAWGIDRSLLNERTIVKEKSYGKSQILDRDYYKRAEIEIVIREMADQVATTLRQKNLETGCLSLSISYSHLTKERVFSVQRTITPTSNSKTLSNNLILMFRAKDLGDLPIRALSISYSKLSDNYSTQLVCSFHPKKKSQRLN